MAPTSRLLLYFLSNISIKSSRSSSSSSSSSKRNQSITNRPTRLQWTNFCLDFRADIRCGQERANRCELLLLLPLLPAQVARARPCGAQQESGQFSLDGPAQSAALELYPGAYLSLLIAISSKSARTVSGRPERLGWTQNWRHW